jgi:malate dehydrogenase
MKVTVVGGSGVVGSSAAYRLAQDNKVSEIVLVDLRRNLAEAHALDIGQAMAHRSNVLVRAGEPRDAKDSDVVLVTASVPKKDIEISRREYLTVNLPLVRDTIAPMIEQSPSATWIIASSPVDPLVYLIHRLFSIPRQRVIGLNRNDTTRFRWAIARTLGTPVTGVEGFVLGEHGESQVPIFSSVKIDGAPVSLSQPQRSAVKAEMDNFFVEWNRLQSGRTAGWTSAESVGDIVSTFVSSDGRVWPCSTVLEGEYGIREVAIGVPVKLGPGGVREIVELTLDQDERAALWQSAASVRAMIKDGESFVERSTETDTDAN